MKSRLLALLVVALVSVLDTGVSRLHADVFIKQKQHTDAFTILGKPQPAWDVIQSIWIAPEKIRSDDERRSVIMRLDQRRLYVLDHQQKTYTETPMALTTALGEEAAEEGVSPKHVEGFSIMAQGLVKLKVTVAPTTEKKQIGNWQCSKYVQKTEAGTMTAASNIWATEELKLDYDLFAEFSAALLALQPGLSESLEETKAELAKIKGVPVLSTSTTHMMGTTMTSSQELLEFKQAKAPEGIFDLPEGYVKETE